MVNWGCGLKLWDQIVNGFLDLGNGFLFLLVLALPGMGNLCSGGGICSLVCEGLAGVLGF